MTDLRRMSVFRDVQVAMDFRQMAELGYIDVEFIVYGCAYWEDGERHYIISSNERDIWLFIEESRACGRCTTPVETLKKVSPVPMGQKEAIATNLKIALAEQLQADYPAEFLEAFAQMATTIPVDTAEPILRKICDGMTCTFSEEKLSLAEELIHLAYDGKVLGEISYRDLKQWLAHERANMMEDTVAKDILQKHFHTIMYEATPGNYKKLTNARKEWVLQKKYKLENEGRLVTPIYSKCYWYNNQQSIDLIKTWHQANCERILNEEYFAWVKAIAACAGAFDQAWFAKESQRLADIYGKKAQQMLSYYAHRWHVLC